MFQKYIFLEHDCAGDFLRWSSAAPAVSRDGSPKDSEVLEIWKGIEGALLEPPGISSDGRRAVIVVRRSGKLLLHILSADGAELKPIAGALGAQGSASWVAGRKVDCYGREQLRRAGTL